MDEPDELTSLEIYNTVWPHDAVTIDAVHSFRDSAQDYIDYLVREDGVILGSGVGGYLRISRAPCRYAHHRARRATPTRRWHSTV